MSRPQSAAEFDKKKVVAENRRARFDYAVEQVFEAGIALQGTEVKSLRFGEGTIAESYAEVVGGEVWLINANIPEFSHGNRFNHEPRRPRKLLLKEREINKLHAGVMRQGMTIVPLSVYFNSRGRAKVELALAKGKKAHDKRESIKERDWKRDKARLMNWIRRNSPTREELLANRFVRPFAHRVAHSHLWRFTRTSVPRGTALGLFVGLFFLIPGVQILGVALLALPFRANIPIGAAMTFLSNPLTTPFILAASVWVGSTLFGLHTNVSNLYILYDEGASLIEWWHWFTANAGTALLGGLAGLFVISLVSAIVGYVLAALFWDNWIRLRWQRKLRRARDKRLEDSTSDRSAG
jgi:SsrA-binding protein